MTESICLKCQEEFNSETQQGWQKIINFVITTPLAKRDRFGFPMKYKQTHRFCGGTIIYKEKVKEPPEKKEEETHCSFCEKVSVGRCESCGVYYCDEHHDENGVCKVDTWDSCS